jgi:hypothetical protein
VDKTEKKLIDDAILFEAVRSALIKSIFSVCTILGLASKLEEINED